MKRSLIICTSVLLVGSCLFGCVAALDQESRDEFLDSSMVTTDIKAKLIDDPLTSNMQIKVNTFKGLVQLSGFVDNQIEKNRASDIAYSVGGVKEVKNDLIIKGN
ncbi:MAG: BON domain-containing protein [Gammaproteobacteria bacterium]|nr:BON domain-containing protein [Gammaproteobacteria bacterium]